MLERNEFTNLGTSETHATTESDLRRLSGDSQRINREWLGLRDLTYYANVSERTIRSWIHSPIHPLPAVKVSGKVLVRKADFDAYLRRHSIRPLEQLNLDVIVRDVMKGATNGR